MWATTITLRAAGSWRTPCPNDRCRSRMHSIFQRHMRLLARTTSTACRSQYSSRSCWCCIGTTAIDSRVSISEKGSTLPVTSVTDSSLATTFRWPGAFGSQAVSVSGESSFRAAASQLWQWPVKPSCCMPQAHSTTGPSHWPSTSHLAVGTGM